MIIRFLQRTRTFIGILMLFVGVSSWGQYNGIGVFNKITSIDDLTDGYYVVLNGGTASGGPYAMNNSHNGTFLDRTAVSPSSDAITNPSTAIVWKIETNGSGRTIYNEASAKFVSYTGTSNNVQVVDAVTTNNQIWNVTYTSNQFRFTNAQLNTRRLQYNATSPRFACYTGSQQDLFLYKLAVASDTPPTATAVAFSGDNLNIGTEQTGTYTYNDVDGDLEGTTTFKWYRSATGTGAGTPIGSATSQNYTLQVADEGQFVRLGVTPVDENDVAGDEAFSIWKKVNTRPVASLVTISGVFNTTQTLTGNYTYSDADTDPEGTSLFEWFRADDVSGTNATLISGATSQSYILQEADLGKFIRFGVLPVDDNLSVGQVAYSEWVGPVAAAGTPSITVLEVLTENSLNGDITLTLVNTEFVDSTLTLSNFTLNNAPDGLTVANVTYVSATEATLTLAYDNTDFDTNITNFIITIDGSELTSAGILTTADLTIFAEIETLEVSGTLAFGNQCLNETSNEQSFTISGTSLKNANINVAALSGYSYSETFDGTYTSSLSFAHSGGDLASKTIYVKFTPTSETTFNGDIVVSSLGASSVNQAVTGSGINTPPTVTTPTSTSITATTATLGGNITVEGCNEITVRGVEYSTTDGFTNGTGTQVFENGTFSTGTFTTAVTGLTSNTTYYYKAFVISSSGTAYSMQGTFTTNVIAAPVATAATNISSDSFTANWNAVAGATSYEIDVYTSSSFNLFSEDFTSFTGTGFSPNPSAGQLNSNIWKITGWSDGILNFGETKTSGDFARGASAIAVSTGGIYSFAVASGNNAFGFQPGGSDWAPGTVVLKITNTTGTTLNSLNVSYKIYVRNDQNRSSSFNFSHSSDDINYTNVPSLDYTSPATSDALGWISVDRSTEIIGLSIPNNTSYYIRWSGADVAGSGSRDEFGLDDINVTGSNSVNILQNENVGNVTSYEVSGLDPNKTYKYVVRAFDANSESVNSNEIEVYTPCNELELSAFQADFTGCNYSTTFTITSGSDAYDTFEWSPSIGVIGNEIDGWQFDPSSVVSSFYTLTATHSESGCSSTFKVAINSVNSGSPLSYEIEDDCAEVKKISINNPGTSTRKTFYSGLINSSIPDNDLTTGLTSELSITNSLTDLGGSFTEPETFFSMTVRLNIKHTNNSDLRINLEAPNGEIINLVNQAGGSGQNFSNADIIVNTHDASLIGLPTSNVEISGTFRAAKASQGLVGTTPAVTTSNAGDLVLVILGDWGYSFDGTWKLRVYDGEIENVGHLEDWSISFSQSTSPTSLQLNVNTVTGLYTDENATISFNGFEPNNANPLIVYAKPENNTNYVFSSNSGYSDCIFSNISIPINAIPVVEAGENQEIVEGETTELGATELSNGLTGTWSILEGPSTDISQITNTSLYNSDFTPIGGNGDYVLRWSVSTFCGVVTSDVTITVKPVTWNGSNWNNIDGPTSILNANIQGNLSLNNNINVKNLTLTSGILDLNGQTLTVTGNVQENGGKINAETGKVVFENTSNATIAAGVFENNTVKELELNTPNQVNFGGVVRIKDVLKLAQGTLNSNGHLVLVSDANNTARVAPVGAGATVTGDVIAERYMIGQRKWRLMSSPVVPGTQNTVWDQWQNGGVPNGATGANLFGPGGNLATNGLHQAGGVGIFEYPTTDGATGWVPVSNTKTAVLSNGNFSKGYLVFITNPFTTTATNITGTDASATTLTPKGTLQIGTVNVPTSGFGLHTLVGNPYASPISPEAILTTNSTNFRNRLWVFDTGIGSNGGYVVFDGTLGAYTNEDGTYSNSPVTPIQSGQAFLVKPEAGTPNFVFEESHKVTENANLFRNQASSSSIEQVRVSLSRWINNQWRPEDAVVAAFANGFSNDLDGDDITKMAKGGENLALRHSSTNLTVEYRDVATVQDTLTVRVTGVANGGQYRLRLFTRNYVNAVAVPYLYDTFTESLTEIPTNESVVEYTFETSSAAPTSAGDRFRIVFQDAPLSVDTPQITKMHVYPNPAQEGYVYIDMGNASSGHYTFNVVDMLGKSLLNETREHNGQRQRLDVSILPAGMYVVQISKGSEKHNVKLIVE